MPFSTVVLIACIWTAVAGTPLSSHAHVGMWTYARVVAAGPGSVATVPMRQLPVTSAISALPSANGGVLRTAAGGTGGGAFPARKGAVNAKSAFWHEPP